MQVAAPDSPQRDVDVTADQAHEQRGERKTGRQPDHLEGVADYVDLDQYEKKTENYEKKYRVEKEKRRDDHGAMISGVQFK